MHANMTRHASIRQQQRGIPSLLVDLLLDFGSSEPAGEGASLLFFDKQAMRRLDRYAGPLAKILKDHLDVYAIVSGQTVITTGHRYERVRRG